MHFFPPPPVQPVKDTLSREGFVFQGKLFLCFLFFEWKVFEISFFLLFCERYNVVWILHDVGT